MRNTRDWSFLILALGLLFNMIIFGAHKSLNYTVTDVSWPNCNDTPSTPYYDGIVGVTGGLDFHKNACASKEASWMQHYQLYMNTGYPGEPYAQKYDNSPLSCPDHYSVCLSYDYGYNAAEYALKTADSMGLYSTFWWLDVETDNSWTSSALTNQANLVGAIVALETDSPFSAFGIYSTPNQWFQITGGWKPSLPEWLGTGSLSKQVASQGCSATSFTGGPIWLSQYTKTLDANVICAPAFAARINGPELHLGQLNGDILEHELNQ
jgi:hypothetical protein